jgi:membrane protein CcdC involved in cytochrome C biogenesis
MDFRTENNKMWISGELVPKVVYMKVFFSLRSTHTQDFVIKNGRVFLRRSRTQDFMTENDKDFMTENDKVFS